MYYLQDYTTYCAQPTPPEKQLELKKGEKVVDEVAFIELAKRRDLYNEPGVLVLPYALDSSIEEPNDEWVLWEYDELKQELRTQNLVGFIGYTDEKGKTTNFAIGSRFSSFSPSSSKLKKEENAEVLSKDYFLLYLLQKTLGITLFDSLKSGSSQDCDSALDFLFLFFPSLFKKALSQGMFKQYVYRQYNDANIRGVIDVNRHIRFNIPANGKVAYHTREFSYDNPLTQLIRHTIEYLKRNKFGKSVLTGDAEMRGFVQQIIQATPSYAANQRQQVIMQNLRPVAHPLYTQYVMLQQLCLRILRYEKLSYGDNNNNEKIHGVLIDINWLWEEYLAQVLSEKTNFGHYTRKSKPNFLFEDGTEDFQKIIPDYLGHKGNQTIVADAKYMFLNNTKSLPVEKAMAVYYKTIMYMYRFNSKIGLLLYPYKPEQKSSDNEIPFVEYGIKETDGKFYKIGLKIPKETKDSKEFKDLSDFIETIKEEEKRFSKMVQTQNQISGNE